MSFDLMSFLLGVATTPAVIALSVACALFHDRDRPEKIVYRNVSAPSESEAVKQLSSELQYYRRKHDGNKRQTALWQGKHAMLLLRIQEMSKKLTPAIPAPANHDPSAEAGQGSTKSVSAPKNGEQA